MVVDLGVHKVEYQGQAKQLHQVYLRWEVPDERVTYERDGAEADGPCVIGATYTLSLSEKANLRKVLENWRGKGFTEAELRKFDITCIAGKACQIMVTHRQGGNGKTYANVTGVMGISKDQQQRAKEAKPESGVVVYSLETPDASVYAALPNWLREKLEDRVMATVKAPPPAEAVEEFNDEIPF
jgi:hypothetical protein